MVRRETPLSSSSAFTPVPATPLRRNNPVTLVIKVSRADIALAASVVFSAPITY